MTLLVVVFTLAQPSAAHPPLPLAIAEADAAIREEPSSPDAFLRRARLWLELGELEHAAEDVERAAERGGEPLAVDLLRARVLLDAGAAGEAHRLLSRQAAREPFSPRVFLLLAETESRQDRPGMAAAALERLTEEVERPAPDVFLRLADAWRLAGREDRARDALREGVERLGPVPAFLAALGEAAATVEPRGRKVARPRGRAVGAPRPAETPPTLLRGPYVQRATSSSVVIRWRTSSATTSRVRHGAAPGALDQTVDDAFLVIDHAVEIAGLPSGSVGYYSIGTIDGSLEVASPDQTFRTAPLPGDERPVRVWILGDSGTGNADAEAVRDAFLSWNDRPLDLWLMLGDNAYPDGTDAEYQSAVFDVYPATLRSVVLWPVLGNHDGHSASSSTQTGPWFDIFTLPAAGEAGGAVSGTEAYYSFDWGPVHFVMLNSYDSDRSPGGAMLTWLGADLAASEARWTIAAWHHPPYSKGSHDSDLEAGLIEMRQNVVPVLESHGVALVLAGHSHSYERSVLLDGHYGASGTLAPSMVLDAGDGDPAGDGQYARFLESARGEYGAVYAVAGSSGRVSAGAPLDHPIMIVATETLGSLVLDIAGDRLDVAFLDDAGVVGDSFRILSPTIFRDGFEDGTTAAWSSP